MVVVVVVVVVVAQGRSPTTPPSPPTRARGRWARRRTSASATPRRSPTCRTCAATRPFTWHATRRRRGRSFAAGRAQTCATTTGRPLCTWRCGVGPMSRTRTPPEPSSPPPPPYLPSPLPPAPPTTTATATRTRRSRSSSAPCRRCVRAPTRTPSRGSTPAPVAPRGRRWAPRPRLRFFVASHSFSEMDLRDHDGNAALHLCHFVLEACPSGCSRCQLTPP